MSIFPVSGNDRVRSELSPDHMDRRFKSFDRDSNGDAAPILPNHRERNCEGGEP